MGSSPTFEGWSIDCKRVRVSGAGMSYERGTNSSSGTLNRREREILEHCAGGLNDEQIAIRFQVGVQEISTLRRQAAAKLVARIASAHPFQIHEVVLAGSLKSGQL
jgi:DNA-binding CsgD family transcriptional regulator